MAESAYLAWLSPVLHSAAVTVGQLVDAYRTARKAPVETRATAPGEADAVERALAALWARGRAAHPELAVDDGAFAAHLGRCGAVIDPIADGAQVHAEDLFLCCAGLAGDERAIRELRAGYRGVLERYLRRLDPSLSFADEVEQRLWDAVLIGSDGTPP
jgi:hypothetical protein